MKNILFHLLFILTISVCNAQNQGTIIPKQVNTKADGAKSYVYQPPLKLTIPEKIHALVVYENKELLYSKTLPLNKVGNNYEFTFTAPDSTDILIFGIMDAKNNAIDNNNEKGFIVTLLDSKGKPFLTKNITMAKLLSGYAQFILRIKEVPKVNIIKIYEDEYKIHPVLKKRNSYFDYLTILYKEKKDTVKSKLLAYAKQMTQTKNDESKWRNAGDIYRLLKMDEDQKDIEQKATLAYPNGQVAKDKFWENFYSDKSPTVKSRLASLTEYISRFKDSTAIIKDNFYISILSLLLDNKEWDKLEKYEFLVKNKVFIAHLYNTFAWKLSGEKIDNPGNDLEMAKTLSKKSLEYTDSSINNKENESEDKYIYNPQGLYNMFSETYSLILYKLGQYDSAFYYQDQIYKQGNELNTEGLERYAVYAEKVKGAAYTKHIIEQQLLNGINSPTMTKQLQSIYKQLQLPENEFNKLQEKTNLLAKQKMSESIKAKFGVTKANDFKLKNLKGQNISLSSFKNKVVVIDFWATWCVPCRASFPAMQELVNNYKQDSSVVFLFIDVWENKSPEKMQEMAQKLMTDGNYNFNVLLDTKDKVVDNFRVDAIPSKFIIDKKGEIVFMGETSNIALEIKKAKN